MSNNKKNQKKKKRNNLQKEVSRREVKAKKLVEEELKKNHNKKVVNLWLFFVYVLFLVLVAYLHEPWRDEAQSWLIAKNLNLLQIIGQLKYEGHPFVWYYFLKVFAFLRLSYKYITIIPVILNSIATYLLLKKSRFNIFSNIAIIFSAGLFFYCGVIARSYSLMYLLVILLIYIYSDRYKKPVWYGLLLFLIMNTHVLLLGFVSGLVIIDIYEFIKNKENKKAVLVSSLMYLVGLVMLVIQFCNTAGSTGKTVHIEYLKYVFSSTINLLMPLVGSIFLAVITILAIIIYIVYLVYKKQYRNLVILSCGLLFQILFATLIYSSLNTACLVYINILFVFMLHDKVDKFITVVAIVIFVCTFYETFYLFGNDSKYLFSDSSNLANYIVKNVDTGSKIYCENLDYCTAAIAYLPDNEYHFIDYNTGKEYTYTNYGDYLKVRDDKVLYKLDDYFDKKDMKYYVGILSDKEIIEEKDNIEDYDLVYETKGVLFYSYGDSYVVYKRK